MDNSIKIARFLSNDLNESELDEFYAELESDEGLLAELTQQTITDFGRVGIKEKLKKVDSKIHKRKSIRYNYIGIAASIVLLVGLSIYFTNHKTINRDLTDGLSNSANSINYDSIAIKTAETKEEAIADVVTEEAEETNEQIAVYSANKTTDEANNVAEKINLATLFSAYPKPTYRSEEGAINKAFSYYDKEQYDSAQLCFTKALLTTEEDDDINEILFYKSISLFAVRRDAKSLNKTYKTLKLLFEDKLCEYREQAAWYMALVLLEQKERIRALELLEIISKEKSFNHELASQLIQQLNSTT